MARSFADGRGEIADGIALAAVLGEIGQQAFHRGILGCIDKRAAFPAKRDETRVPELVQMKRERSGWQPQPFADPTSRQPARTCLHKQPKDIKPRVLGECCEGGDGV